MPDEAASRATAGDLSAAIIFNSVTNDVCDEGITGRGNIMEKTTKKYWPLFVLPTMLAFIIGFIVPFVYGIFLSFCKFTTVTDWKWTGLLNYSRIFYVNGQLDTTFLHSIWYTCLFTAVTVVIINVVAFAIAMALTRGIKGTTFFRTAFFLPNLIGGIVLSYVWLMIFNAILDDYSKTIVSTQWTAFWGLVIVVCWQQIGYMMIIYIAGIQNIPGDLIEAAKIDGANNRQLLRYVTIPVTVQVEILPDLGRSGGFTWKSLWTFWDARRGKLVLLSYNAFTAKTTSRIAPERGWAKPFADRLSEALHRDPSTIENH